MTSVHHLEYVALAVDFKMKVDDYLYEYDNQVGHMYKVSYNKNMSNELHRLLKFKYQKRYVLIENDNDELKIVGHYDDMHDEPNKVWVDLHTKTLQLLKD